MQIEERITDWIECKDGPWWTTLPFGGYKAYRIYQQFDGMRWHQKHEWLRVDGKTEDDGWIAGVDGWV